ncbi:MAG TPA: helix-turn-helix domain-containing protein [Candidatus Coprenecus stercoravium]|uniref:Helix-turn-helix domain-containing protein n=1 Tax=Candidatus Coprenecus stercoravium TaxID=2840735 RepID=A0A9D2K9J3_9BACT|nr:helix-turn-helix domain-containing protein [Candidatus Coprenecus stercoravium]
MTDNKELEIIKKLKECGKSSYYIAKKTGLSNSSIANWLNGKTSPNPANIAILEHFFEIEDGKGSNNINAGVISHSTVNQDNRSYYSDSPDVLRARIEQLDRLIEEKEYRIKEKDAQIKEKDAQIKALLEIVAKK